MSGAARMKLRPVARVAGIIALVPFALLPVLMLIGRFAGPFPDWVLATMMIWLLADIPLGIFSAIFWTKWLFAVAFLAAALVVSVAYLSAGHLG